MVQVDAGAAIAGVTVSLVRGAAIAGRILDELGDPLITANVVVEAAAGAPQQEGCRAVDGANQRPRRLSRWQPARGRLRRQRRVPPQLQVCGGRQRGGRAAVSADYSASADGSVMTINGVNAAYAIALANRGPQRLYFPNAPTVLEAEAISLKAGQERPSVDLVGPVPAALPTSMSYARRICRRLQLDRTAKATGAIRGRVLGSTGQSAGRRRGTARRAMRFDRCRRPAPTLWVSTSSSTCRAGSYRVNARKSATCRAGSGRRRTSERGERIALAEDERRDRADITLPRTSAIAGRLTDEYGDPVEGVTIRAQQIRFVSGRRRLVEVSGAASSRTDDPGRYRVSGLQPGSYVVAAYVGQLVSASLAWPTFPGTRRRTFPERRTRRSWHWFRCRHRRTSTA